MGGQDAGSYYAILGVSKTATDDELKKAYRKLAMQWHPVRLQPDSPIAGTTTAHVSLYPPRARASGNNRTRTLTCVSFTNSFLFFLGALR